MDSIRHRLQCCQLTFVLLGECIGLVDIGMIVPKLFRPVFEIRFELRSKLFRQLCFEFLRLFERSFRFLSNCVAFLFVRSCFLSSRCYFSNIGQNICSILRVEIVSNLLSKLCSSSFYLLVDFVSKLFTCGEVINMCQPTGGGHMGDGLGSHSPHPSL